MTLEISQEDWARFFDDLSKRRFEWQVRIEIISEEIGDQILDEGLPLRGITHEERNGRSVIAISVGQDSDHHQTHNITDPARINYLSDARTLGGIVEIEEKNGTKTLIHIIKPMPLAAGYAGESRGITAA